LRRRRRFEVQGAVPMKKVTTIRFSIILILVSFMGCRWDFDVEYGSKFRSIPPLTNLKGWELDETNSGLRGNYTGLTTINPSEYGRIDEGGQLLVNANAVIENKIIPYQCTLSAGNITIRNCLIQPTTVGNGVPFVTATMATIEDSEIDGSLMSDAVMGMSIAFAGSGTILRCNIHDASSGISINNSDASPSIAEGNYIHDLRYVSPAHMDGITTRVSAGGGTVIRNNRSVVDSTVSTGALFVQSTYGVIDNLLIEGNLLEGYSYNLSMGISTYSYGGNVGVVDNRFNPYPGGFGARSIQSGIVITEWSENYIYDSAADGCMGTPLVSQ
jgi:hypothetical protein